jgi:predicted TIM-barrel fold metal-dependent hydrolase
LNLLELAKRGVTRVDLVAQTTDSQKVKVLNFQIDWDPISNQAKLILVQEDEQNNQVIYDSCPPEAHQEEVALKYLKDAISI